MTEKTNMKKDISEKAQNMLQGFTSWLKKPAEGWTMTYDNNKHMIKECGSAKDAFSELYTFEDLRGECPLPYEDNSHGDLVSNDTLWTEDLIQEAFANA